MPVFVGGPGIVASTGAENPVGFILRATVLALNYAVGLQQDGWPSERPIGMPELSKWKTVRDIIVHHVL